MHSVMYSVENEPTAICIQLKMNRQIGLMNSIRYNRYEDYVRFTEGDVVLTIVQPKNGDYGTYIHYLNSPQNADCSFEPFPSSRTGQIELPEISKSSFEPFPSLGTGQIGLISDISKKYEKKYRLCISTYSRGYVDTTRNS